MVNTKATKKNTNATKKKEHTNEEKHNDNTANNSYDNIQKKKLITGLGRRPTIRLTAMKRTRVMLTMPVRIIRRLIRTISRRT